RQQIVVAFQVAPMAAKALAAKAALIQLVLLNHGAHGAVEQHDALFQQAAQALDACSALDLVRRHDAERRGGRAGRSALAFPAEGVPIHRAHGAGRPPPAGSRVATPSHATAPSYSWRGARPARNPKA